MPTAPVVTVAPEIQIGAPTNVAPASGARFLSGSQITFTVTAPSTNGTRPLQYTFEFSSMEAPFVVERHEQSSSPSITLALSGDGRRWFRAYADDGEHFGVRSSATDFELYTPVTFAEPTLISPIGEAVTVSLRPRLSWNAAPHSGNPAAVTYSIEVSDSPQLTSPTALTTDQTSLEVPQEIPPGVRRYWRVRASDGAIVGAWSRVESFWTPPDGTFWSNDEWHQYFLQVLQQHNAGPTVNLPDLNATQADLLLHGGDWQHNGSGGLRPRIYISVPGCPPVTWYLDGRTTDCTWGRAIDVGLYDDPWTWIVR
jgi:hypothetical protein